MILYNIKQKEDLIQLKKNLKKKAEVENLEEMGYQVNLEKAYKPLTEPLNKFVEETQETKKVLEAIKNIPKILPLDDKPPPLLPKKLPVEDKPPPLLAIEGIPIQAYNLGKSALKYLSNGMYKNVYDTTYGLKPIEGSTQFQQRNKKVYIFGNNIKIEGKLYELGENYSLSNRSRWTQRL